jgi:hypothetical protein
VGDIHSSGPLQTSRPEWQDGFLAFFKAYTDEPNSSASVGKLEQLQLVWTSKSCAGEQKQQLAEAILGEARDPAVQRTNAKSQAPPADAAAGGQPAEAEVVVEEVLPEEMTDALNADPAAAAANATQPAAAAAGPEVTAIQGPAAAAAAGAADADADADADATMMADADAAASAAAAASEAQAAAAAAATVAPAETPAEASAAVAAVVTTIAVEEETPAEVPATAQPAAATTTTTTTTAVSTPAPAAAAAAPAAAAAKPGKSKSIFVGPQRRSPDDAPSSSTVINTTTIITSTTTDKIPTPTDTTYTTSTLTSATTTTTAVCTPGGNCANGTCVTSSCMLNGMGKDVATMMCFGTNLMPNPLLEALTGNPCTNLACKLDRPNCTTTNFGLDGFCTGASVDDGAAQCSRCSYVCMDSGCQKHGVAMTLFGVA